MMSYAPVPEEKEGKNSAFCVNRLQFETVSLPQASTLLPSASDASDGLASSLALLLNMTDSAAANTP